MPLSSFLTVSPQSFTLLLKAREKEEERDLLLSCLRVPPKKTRERAKMLAEGAREKKLARHEREEKCSQSKRFGLYGYKMQT